MSGFARSQRRDHHGRETDRVGRPRRNGADDAARKWTRSALRGRVHHIPAQLQVVVSGDRTPLDRERHSVADMLVIQLAEEFQHTVDRRFLDPDGAPSVAVASGSVGTTSSVFTTRQAAIF